MEHARAHAERGARSARVGLVGLTALLLACAVASLSNSSGGVADLLGRWGYNVVLVGSALACLAGAALRSRERTAWWIIGGAALVWAVGNIYYAGVLWDADPIPIPSPSDAMWLPFYPLSYVGLVLLARRRIAAPGITLWLDGAIAALAVAAFGAASVFGRVLEATDGEKLEIATNLAYPLGDTVLLGVVTGAIALGGWRFGRMWVLLGGGFALFGVADSVYLVGNALGTWTTGSIGEAGWPAGFLLIAYAAWAPDDTRAPTRDLGRRALLAPIAFAVLGLGLLISDHFERLNLLAVTLAWLCVVAVLGRFAASYAANLRTLRSARGEALTDALTGIANRRRLMRDLQRAVDSDEAHLLALFDLNGFKDYNDTFGHPAGDALLVRLSERLDAAVGDAGRAYRMGGDEFCVLARCDAIGALSLTSACADALREVGSGFVVTAASGSVLLPAEARDPAAALGRADRRMYDDKAGGRRSAQEQATRVLLRALTERHHELEQHVQGVGSLAAVVGERLGLDPHSLEDLRRAGELHDIGKIAVPASILDKPEPLDDDEWAIIREHTVVGERIVLAATSLESVAPLVRASHERWDGAGYPDRLAGHDIPLGARIVAACDALEAMTGTRPYRRPVSVEEALVELQRCAGSQFDPVVVDAIVAVHRSRDPRDEERSTQSSSERTTP